MRKAGAACGGRGSGALAGEAGARARRGWFGSPARGVRTETYARSMTTNDLPVIAAVDGSTHSRQALDWATREAVRRALPLLIVHVRPLTRQIDEETGRREAEELLAESVRRSAIIAPELRPSTLAPLDFPSAALVSLARDASMVVVGSRGLGGFRSLMTGSNSLATASMASCPVVIVRDDRPEGDGDRDTEAPKPAPTSWRGWPPTRAARRSWSSPSPPRPPVPEHGCGSCTAGRCSPRCSRAGPSWTARRRRTRRLGRWPS